MGTDAAIDIATRISGATADIATRVTGAIRDAARVTGAGFEYLLNTAIRESNLNPNAKARTSSATGLFQFIDQTWLGTMKQSGASLGYGKYADAITRTPQGKYVVNDPAMRNEIFALRKDASANAKMAGAFANSNAKFLKERLGRTATDGELYMAHFFGTGGAGQLINAAKDRPQANSTVIFPAAARANKSIFYDRQGNARSVAGVYSELNRRYQVARVNVLPGGAPTAIAANTAVPSPTRAAPDTGGITQAFAAAAPRPVVAAAEPTFRSLFQNEGRGAVSPLVSNLWTTPSESPAPVPASTPTVTVQAVTPARAQEPLDLFREMRPDVRSLFRGNGRA